METKELIKYEMPVLYEYVSFDWAQKLLAKRLARKVTRKMRRYDARLALAKRVKEQL